MTSWNVATTFVALLAFAAPAWAQPGPRTERTMGGFWIGAEYGVGWSHVDCPGCAAAPANGDPWGSSFGYATGLAVGGTPLPNLEVGGEFAYYRTFREQGRIAEVSYAGALARWWPGTSPVHLRAGLGVGTLDLSDADLEPARRVSEPALTARFGAGYDVDVGGAFSLVPSLGVTGMLTGGGTDARWPVYVSATLSLTRR